MAEVETDEVATAIKAAITAHLPSGSEAYDADELPSPRPIRYVETDLSRISDYDGTATMRRNPRRYRLTARVIANTETNARVYTDRVMRLEFARITVGDSHLTGPLRFETWDPLTYSDNVWTGLTSWHFTLEESS